MTDTLHTTAQARAALIKQYDMLYDAVYRYIFFRVRHQPLAEDLTQDIFIRALTAINRYDPAQATLKTWMLSIARFRLIDHWRGDHLIVDIDTVDADDHQLAVHQIVDTVDSQLLYHRLLAQLPIDRQILCALRFIDDLTYEEIAQITEQTPTAIRMFFSRLRKRYHYLYDQ